MAIVTALAAAAVAASVAGRGCGPGADSPDGVVRALVVAARAGDRQTVYDLLSPATQGRLQQYAQRASELGERRYEAAHMVGLGAERDEDARFEVKSRDGDTAVVLIVSRSETVPIAVVRVDGKWRVELN